MLACALLLATLALGTHAASAAPDAVGAVYVLSNAAAGNEVIVFNRAADGTLTPAGSVSTQGLGNGGGLGSQGPLVLSENDHWLFAVNAGSNDISVLRVEHNALTFVTRVPSGGIMPVSLTVSHDLLYVLNAGSSTITGFRIGHDGALTALPGSTRPLSGANVGPAQVSFSPDGKALVVTEKATNLIDTYVVGRDGLAAGPIVHASAGATPFGFAFAGRDQLIVSDAFGGAANAGAVSSYTLAKDGGLDVVNGAAPTYQTAPCWVAATENGRYAYTANAGSGSITGYRVDHNGQLTLLTPNGQTGLTGPGSHPIDLGFSHNSRYLYVAANGTGIVAAFQIGADGSLTPLAGATGLPASAAGVAAR
jgi:6-phosphogluconolactonase (cycloisomerase 2 family)